MEATGDLQRMMYMDQALEGKYVLGREPGGNDQRWRRGEKKKREEGKKMDTKKGCTFQDSNGKAGILAV